ncbi:uncharacterized protein BT62DRAFT_1081265 [Guyanagaster necrorhizus]|uniref:Uncharacterized protein n=1 Tax=Guyanagaster necrorhizus TaxID=856835 RepID=A0A9P7VGW7_9AGAR|nr:uncharacterized protein BT62DRAFT_1081265 [Guyanagaster necrorhizus MCA 3950]KAG7439871.1 hypothetical protein BT62DRAFT_1081265 [Guyanagaster necrorhizus MCA 3950]
MDSYPIGSRVFFYDAAGCLVGGVVESTTRMGNGTQIVRIKCDDGRLQVSLEDSGGKETLPTYADFCGKLIGKREYPGRRCGLMMAEAAFTSISDISFHVPLYPVNEEDSPGLFPLICVRYRSEDERVAQIPTTSAFGEENVAPPPTHQQRLSPISLFEYEGHALVELLIFPAIPNSVSILRKGSFCDFYFIAMFKGGGSNTSAFLYDSGSPRHRPDRSSYYRSPLRSYKRCVSGIDITINCRRRFSGGTPMTHFSRERRARECVSPDIYISSHVLYQICQTRVKLPWLVVHLTKLDVLYACPERPGVRSFVEDWTMTGQKTCFVGDKVDKSETVTESGAWKLAFVTPSGLKNETEDKGHDTESNRGFLMPLNALSYVRDDLLLIYHGVHLT